MNAGNSKMRLSAWLRERLASGKPDIFWRNETEEFSIPWPHKSKVGNMGSDIFTEWAKHTGLYAKAVAEDQDVFSRCKANLRSALNKAPDIVYLEDKSSKKERVYRFQSKPNTGKGMPASSAAIDNGVSVALSMVSIPSLPLVVEQEYDSSEVSPGMSSDTSDSSQDITDSSITADMGDAEISLFGNCSQTMSLTKDLEKVIQAINNEETMEYIPEDLKDVQPYQSDLLEGENSLIPMAVGPYPNQTPEVPVGSFIGSTANVQGNSTRDALDVPLHQCINVQGHNMLIGVFYKGDLLGEFHTNNRNGCIIAQNQVTEEQLVKTHGRNRMDEFYGEGYEQKQFIDLDPLIEKYKQRFPDTKKFSKWLRRGFSIEIVAHSIILKKNTSLKIASKNSFDGEATPLPSRSLVKEHVIFEAKQFLSCFSPTSKTRPKPSVYLCLSEPKVKSDVFTTEPMELVIRVTSCAALQYLKEWHQHGGENYTPDECSILTSLDELSIQGQ